MSREKAKRLRINLEEYNQMVYAARLSKTTFCAWASLQLRAGREDGKSPLRVTRTGSVVVSVPNPMDMDAKRIRAILSTSAREVMEERGKNPEGFMESVWSRDCLDAVVYNEQFFGRACDYRRAIQIMDGLLCVKKRERMKITHADTASVG